MQSLLAGSDVDRAGVWIDDGESEGRSPRGLAIFRGLVSERDGDGTPAEWTRLSLEGLASLELLVGGRVVEQVLDGMADQLMLGALLELQRAVWAPVGARGRLRGVILAGTRRKHGTLPLARIETVSAELALAIELEEERRLSRQRRADLNATSRLLAELAVSGPIDPIFTRLVDGCTETAPSGDGLGAVFAILRTRVDSNALFDRLPHPVGRVSRAFVVCFQIRCTSPRRALLAERRRRLASRDRELGTGEYLATSVGRARHPRHHQRFRASLAARRCCTHCCDSAFGFSRTGRYASSPDFGRARWRMTPSSVSSFAA